MVSIDSSAFSIGIAMVTKLYFWMQLLKIWKEVWRKFLQKAHKKPMRNCGFA